MIKIKNEKEKEYYMNLLKKICDAIESYNNLKNSPRGFIFLSNAFCEEDIDNEKEIEDKLDNILNRR